MEENFYKTKYFKYKAKYYKLLEQRGGMNTENKANPFATDNLPEPDSQGRIYTDTSQRLDFLTEEGLRQRGLVSENSTSLDGEEINGEVKPSIPILKLKKGEQIVSPFTGSTEVCQVENFLWMDIDTEETFMVYFS